MSTDNARPSLGPSGHPLPEGEGVEEVQNVASPTVIDRSDHPISRRSIPENVLKVLYRLHRSGYRAYLCGGSVRDLLMDREPKDFDVATDAHPMEVRRLFRRRCLFNLLGRLLSRLGLCRRSLDRLRRTNCHVGVREKKIGDLSGKGAEL